jgi:Ser/Thr protein kinase RdoA (MazF antagonist)
MLALPFLPLWDEIRGGTPVLVNHSENHTYFVKGYVLRIHPPSRSREAIEDELAWLRALADVDFPIPRQVGDVREVDGRHGVLFEFISGGEPRPTERLFHTLGGYTATLHLRTIEAPHRPVWDERLLDADGPWGDWRAFGDLGEVDQWLRAQLAAYGKTQDRFGLIHADMRLANLLQSGERVAVIDFDDCGHGWFMYDFAAALSFLETDPRVPAWRDAWVGGYTAIRHLSANDLAVMPAMILLRRMALCAWMSEHRDTVLARTYAAGFEKGTLALLKRARSGGLLPQA